MLLFFFNMCIGCTVSKKNQLTLNMYCHHFAWLTKLSQIFCSLAGRMTKDKEFNSSCNFYLCASSWDHYRWLLLPFFKFELYPYKISLNWCLAVKEYVQIYINSMWAVSSSSFVRRYMFFSRSSSFFHSITEQASKFHVFCPLNLRIYSQSIQFIFFSWCARSFHLLIILLASELMFNLFFQIFSADSRSQTYY